MLKTRIIPILLTDGRGNVVKPIRFQRPYRTVGSLMQHIRVMEKRNVDELIIIDIEATNEGRLIDADRIKDYTKELYCPVTLGGGIKSLYDINRLLNAGADKVAIKSHSEYIINKAAQKFGSQAIIAVIDWESKVYGISYWCKHKEELGAGELLLTDIEQDGTMEGYNYDLISTVSRSVDIPVVANGGCGDVSHMKKALRVGAHAVAAGSMFLFQDVTPRQCAKELKAMGFNTRVE